MTHCEHRRLKPVPQVAKDGLLTGGVTVTCLDCKKVVHRDKGGESLIKDRR